MELAAKSNHLPFKTAKARLKSRYGITLTEDDFIEKAYYIWREIGNIATIPRTYSAVVPQDLVIYVPKDCEFVQAVTSPSLVDARGNSGTITHNSGGRVMEMRPSPAMLTNDYEAKVSTTLKPEGETVNYITGEGYIQLTDMDMYGRTVNIVYDAIDRDVEGLPKLNDREVEAIVANLALQQAQIDMFSRIAGSDKIYAMLKPEADRAMVAAKLPEKISDDAIDRAMDIKVSWDRKTFGNRYKFGL